MAGFGISGAEVLGSIVIDLVK